MATTIQTPPATLAGGGKAPEGSGPDPQPLIRDFAEREP